jgi:cholesterol transport system auxiliary component
VTRRREILLSFGALPLAAALAGCETPLTGAPAPRFDFFVLEDLNAGSAAAPPPATESSQRTLLVSMGQSQALYDSDRIVFSPDGVSRAFFQYSNWSERPARRLASLLERRLAASGAFRSVALTTAGVRGELVLSVRLEELYMDDSVRPPVVHAAVLAELVDWRTRAQLARRSFAQRATAPTADAHGAARAANVALTRLLDELASWTFESAGRAPPPG